jgi:hypothetical protein
MTPAQRQLYARHLLLAEIGEQGQERLCASRVAHAAGDARARVVARDYLERAGLCVDDASTAEPASLQVPLPTQDGVRALAARPELEEAAAALAGAFAAVETIKAALGIAAACALPADLTLCAEDRR